MTKKTTSKDYSIREDKKNPTLVNEPLAAYLSYTSPDDRNILHLINAVRQGLSFSFFSQIAHNSPFTLAEWSGFLHLSERSIQRYKKEKKSFDPIYSEKILEIIILQNLGIQVFGNKENFNIWLESKSIALGGSRPKDLLDSTFGIDLLKDELLRIEHGILA